MKLNFAQPVEQPIAVAKLLQVMESSFKPARTIVSACWVRKSLPRAEMVTLETNATGEYPGST